jgi:hypothetical protein
MPELHEVVHEVAVDIDTPTEVVLDKLIVWQPDLLVHEVVQVDVHNVLV